MVENIKESGNMGSNMEKGNFSTLNQIPGKKEFGVTESEFNGIIILLLRFSFKRIF
jgi:hypothetical protein